MKRKIIVLSMFVITLVLLVLGVITFRDIMQKKGSNISVNTNEVLTYLNDGINDELKGTYAFGVYDDYETTIYALRENEKKVLLTTLDSNLNVEKLDYDDGKLYLFVHEYSDGKYAYNYNLYSIDLTSRTYQLEKVRIGEDINLEYFECVLDGVIYYSDEIYDNYNYTKIMNAYSITENKKKTIIKEENIYSFMFDRTSKKIYYSDMDEILEYDIKTKKITNRFDYEELVDINKDYLFFGDYENIYVYNKNTKHVKKLNSTTTCISASKTTFICDNTSDLTIKLIDNNKSKKILDNDSIYSIIGVLPNNKLVYDKDYEELYVFDLISQEETSLVGITEIFYIK